MKRNDRRQDPYDRDQDPSGYDPRYRRENRREDSYDDRRYDPYRGPGSDPYGDPERRDPYGYPRRGEEYRRRLRQNRRGPGDPYAGEGRPGRENPYDRRGSDDWSGPSNRPRRRKRKSHAFLKTVIFLALILIIPFLVVGHLLYTRLGRITQADNERVQEGQMDPSWSDTLSADNLSWNNANISLMRDPNVKNILLVGQDARSEDTGRARSDAMILLSLNRKTQTMTLVSLMRDMFVPIPDYHANKLNAAFAFGGVKLLDETVEQDFGIPIDDNFVVDLNGFLEAMVQVGDLDIELTAEEAEYLNNNTYYGTSNDTIQESWDLLPGRNSLTPAQALAYARIRYVGNSDWDRTNRQRKLLTAVFHKLQDKESMAMFKILSNILPALKTDMSELAMFGYMLNMAIFHPDFAEESYYLPAEGTYTPQVIYGMQVLYPDLQANSDYLKNILYTE